MYSKRIKKWKKKCAIPECALACDSRVYSTVFPVVTWYSKWLALEFCLFFYSFQYTLESHLIPEFSQNCSLWWLGTVNVWHLNFFYFLYSFEYTALDSRVYSQVFPVVTWYSKWTMALTFENLCFFCCC